MIPKAIFIWITISIGICDSLFSQLAPPELRCITVHPNGDISLTWIPTVDSLNQFTSYHIYTSINGSRFALRTTNLTNRLQNQFTLIGVGFPKVELKNFKIYIVTEYFDGSAKLSSTSDTLTAIELDLTTFGNVSGQLTWNLIKNFPLPTWNSKYDLNRKLLPLGSSPPTNWGTVFTTPNYLDVNFKDSIVGSSTNIYYQLELKDISGCVSKSNIVKALLDNVGIAEEGQSVVTSKIYPNPVSTHINIEITLKKGMEMDFYLYNVNGQLVDQPSLGSGSIGENEFHFGVDHLVKGIYYLRIIGNGSLLSTEKIAVE